MNLSYSVDFKYRFKLGKKLNNNIFHKQVIRKYMLQSSALQILKLKNQYNNALLVDVSPSRNIVAESRLPLSATCIVNSVY